MKIIADANIPFVKECFSSIGKVEVLPGRQITRDALGDAECLLVRSVTKVDSDLLAGSKVRFVGTATIGFEHVDVDYLKERSIGFASAPGSNANSVAEYIVAALLELGRRYGFDLEDKSIGIVGVGNVGGQLEKKCLSLGMIPVLNDPPLKRQTGDSKYQPLEKIYRCDFITLHTPLTFGGQNKTYHLAGEEFFRSLGDDVIFINTSRGGVVDTALLKRAIENNRVKAAVLDVWENEPNIDTELLELVDIGTPHIAGYSLDGKIAGMVMIYKAACEYFGLKAEYGIEDFLPKPEIPEIRPWYEGYSEQQILRAVVGELYEIMEDDTRLRIILSWPANKRGRFFDDLRKNYPVRREFQNTTVELKTPFASLEAALKGIGFKVKVQT
jgi:erythronate-4-phosphate dehydrogenase